MPARLGQHFLIDESVCGRIVRAAAIKAGDRVIEIGPGRGILTRALLEAGAQVLAVELDDRLAAKLAEELGAEPRFKLIHADFLKLELSELGEGPVKFVANLPYVVATPILQRFLPWPRWTSATLMFQKEVAERIVAKPGNGDYGLLTLSALLYAEPELALEVPRECFSPRPQVVSAVVRLMRRAEPLLPAAEIEAFFKVARAAFGQRRKMAAGPIARALSLPREQVVAALERLGIDPSCRAEGIPLEAYLKLPGELGKFSRSENSGASTRRAV